jgi:hypothetical protein
MALKVFADGRYEGVVRGHDLKTVGPDRKAICEFAVELQSGVTDNNEEVHGDNDIARVAYFIEGRGIDFLMTFLEGMEVVGSGPGQLDGLSKLGGNHYDNSPLKDAEVTVSVYTTKDEKTQKTRQNFALYSRRKELTEEEKENMSILVDAKVGDKFAMKVKDAEERRKADEKIVADRKRMMEKMASDDFPASPGLISEANISDAVPPDSNPQEEKE